MEAQATAEASRPTREARQGEGPQDPDDGAALHPVVAARLLNFGVDARQRKDNHEAIAAFLAALEAVPGETPPVFNLGEVLLAEGRHEEAIEWLWKAVRICPIGPGSRHGWYSLGIAHWKMGRPEEALLFLERAARAAPADLEVRHNIAVISLALGRYETGWTEYVWRLVVKRNKRPLSPLPERFERPVYLRCEQGIGDILYFFRWLPALKERGVTAVYSKFPAKIAPVMRRAFPEVIEGFGPEDAVDLFIGDLPLRTGEFGVVPPVAFLDPPAPMIRPAGQRKSVGVTWRAGTKFDLGQWKEAKPELVADMLRAANAIPVLLQRGATLDEKRLFGSSAIDLCADVESPERVLDILPSLDAYVTVSNTNVHLAAGLPNPVRPAMHVLVTHPPEARWMVRGDHSPWFPGMTCYRQNYRGEWEPQTFDRIKEALTHVD